MQEEKQIIQAVMCDLENNPHLQDTMNWMISIGESRIGFEEYVRANFTPEDFPRTYKLMEKLEGKTNAGMGSWDIVGKLAAVAITTVGTVYAAKETNKYNERLADMKMNLERKKLALLERQQAQSEADTKALQELASKGPTPPPTTTRRPPVLDPVDTSKASEPLGGIPPWAPVAAVGGGLLLWNLLG